MPEQAQPQPLKPVLKQGCPDCPPMVVPRRGYTPTRPSCIDCVEKHLGAAMVLLAELNDLPYPPSPDGYGVPSDEASRRQSFSRRLRVIGHLFEAEDESQQWPDLHNAIRQARKTYQASDTMPSFNQLAAIAANIRNSA